ncbi:MAG TPA: immunoglobulin-like domain-containing protein, partial [Catenuloplanes sp.]
MPMPLTGHLRLWSLRTRRSAALLAVMVLSLITASLTVVPVSPANAAEVTDGLALWYKLDETSGTVVKDSSGKNRNGTVNGTAGWTPGEGLAFDGTTSVKVPDDLMAGMQSITVDMDVYVDPTLTGAYWIYGFGNTNNANGEGNGYLFATGDVFRTSISPSNWTGEKNTAPGGNLARGVWKHVTYTQTGTVGTLYADGVRVAQNTQVSVKPGDIGGGRTTNNQLGRSLYRPDGPFKGRIRDFRVYDRAITEAEVDELAREVATTAVQRDAAALTLGNTDSVKKSLRLPARGPGRVSTITWASSNPAVVAPDGTVTRPPFNQPDATVTLTATITLGAAQQTKTFTVKVPRDVDDATKVNLDAAALAVPNLRDVRGNLTLPTKGANGATITWRSTNEKIINTDGVVRRPEAGKESIQVNLVARIALNGASATRTFEALVPPMPPRDQALKGYLFSYFTGQSEHGEQIYAALSRGNDPLKFRELNGSQPILRSNLGDKGVRDPFIIRSPEGDKFYQIATDLRIFGNWQWDVVQRTGSKSIVVWESTDLVNWTDQRLVQISPETAGNTWAPEAYYEPKIGAYVVFWASKTYAWNDPEHLVNTHQKMMYATTRDFHTFSEAKPYITRNSKGEEKAIIDTTMIQHGDTYYRYTKDETRGEQYSEMVFQQKGDGVLGTFENIGQHGTPLPRNAQGGRLFGAEGPTIYKSNTEEKWYLLLDDYSGSGYKAFETTNLDAGDKWVPSTGTQLPRAPRHGTVLPVTQAEYDRIMRRYVPGELVESLTEVEVTTTVGKKPTLPPTVTATFAELTTKPVAVTWDEVPPSAYATAGTFTVLGTIKESTTLKARATVTVVAEDKANAGPDTTGAEGAAIALNGTSVGAGAVSWSFRAGSGVDQGATCTIAAPAAVSTTISCTDDGTYEVDLKVGADTDTATVTVTNAAPMISKLEAPASVAVGTPATVKATFTD